MILGTKDLHGQSDFLGLPSVSWMDHDTHDSKKVVISTKMKNSNIFAPQGLFLVTKKTWKTVFEYSI